MSASRRIIIKAGLKMGADTLMDERERGRERRLSGEVWESREPIKGQFAHLGSSSVRRPVQVSTPLSTCIDCAY